MFTVTGFTPFCGLASNPSQEILKKLKHPEVSKKVLLDVSIKSVEKNLKGLCSGSKFVLHIGLDPEGKQFKLEASAINTKSFSCPDNEGEQPLDSPINPRRGKNTFLVTNLNLRNVVGKLKGFPVVVSKYGGTFVSNYTYYRCLEVCRKCDGPKSGSSQPCAAGCLYVHVPPTSVMPLREQVKFIEKLLDVLRDQLSPGKVDVIEVIERFIGGEQKLPDLRLLLISLR